MKIPGVTMQIHPEFKLEELHFLQRLIFKQHHVSRKGRADIEFKA